MSRDDARDGSWDASFFVVHPKSISCSGITTSRPTASVYTARPLRYVNSATPRSPSSFLPPPHQSPIYPSRHIIADMTQHSSSSPPKANPTGPRTRSGTHPIAVAPRPHPHGPRSLESQSAKRSAPGSSHTRYHTMPVPAKSPSTSIPHQTSSVSEHVDSPVIVDEPETGLPEAPYRPPEAVIDPPEDDPPPYTPGIVAEHIGEDDDMEVDSKFTTKDFNAWQSNLELYDQMEIDQLTSQSSMPQLGPGVLPRRWLAIAHEHELVRPYIEALPPPSKKFHSRTHAQVASGQVSSLSPPPPPGSSPVFASNNPFAHESPRIATLEDVIQALPGDGSDPEHWYFCSTCWGWLKIKAGHGMPPELQSMEEWEAFVIEQQVYPDIESFEKAREQRRDEWARLIGIQNSRLVAPQEHHHFHQFNTLLASSKLARIDKVEVEEHMNVFPHITVGLDPEESWESFNLPHSPSRLFLSDSSDVWISVDEGLVPGQLPVGLVNAFTAEKMSNPNPGLDGVQSVNEAWNLIAT